jgi:hypothetical protein
MLQTQKRTKEKGVKYVKFRVARAAVEALTLAMSFAALKNVGKVSAPFTLDFSFYLVAETTHAKLQSERSFSKPTHDFMGTWIFAFR